MNDRKFENLLKLTPQAVEETLSRLIDTNIINKDSVSVTLGITGIAGIGKTSLPEQVAKKKDIPFHKISLTNVQEVNDLVGFPLKTFQMRRGEETIWAAEELLAAKTAEGYIASGEVHMDYAVPEWVPKTDTPVLLVLDDYTRALPHILQATMEIVDRQEYISWRLPKGSTVVLTTNPSDDTEYMGVNELGKAQMTRFTEIGMEYNVNDWALWASRAGIDDRCIHFMMAYPELATSGMTNPRMFEKFFRLIQTLPTWTDKEDLEFIRTMGIASIGRDAFSNFELFVSDQLHSVVTAKEIFSLDTAHLSKLIVSKSIDTKGNPMQDVTNRLMTTVLGHLFKEFPDKNREIDDHHSDRLKFLNDLKDPNGHPLIGEDTWTMVAHKMSNKGNKKFRKFSQKYKEIYQKAIL